ncbi:MAG: hypothetical protein JST47_05835 [Bacteroidetes bacterium]|nr:hypothetical protein [Bacteroidota bacterium]
MKRRFNPRKLLFIIPMAFAGLALFGWAVMLLWNGILVPVIHVSAISFWQALGILLLSKILFGGFRGAGGGRWGRHRMRKEMFDRWEKMSPEEKEKFKAEWQNRCGYRFRRPFDEQKSGEQP